MSSYENIISIFYLVRTGFFSNSKNIILIFRLIRTTFSYLFCFSIYKMVDSESSTDNYKTLKISIGIVIKYQEMLRFVPDHLKAKNICKHAVEKSFVIRHVPNILHKSIQRP